MHYLDFVYVPRTRRLFMYYVATKKKTIQNYLHLLNRRRKKPHLGRTLAGAMIGATSTGILVCIVVGTGTTGALVGVIGDFVGGLVGPLVGVIDGLL